MNDLVVVEDADAPDCRALVASYERHLALPPRSIQEAIAWHEEARRLRERVRIEKASLELSNRATAIWLARCRQIGSMLAVMPKWSGARTAGFLRGTPTLRELGIRKKQSHEFQLLARIPDDDFRGWVWDRIERGLQLTKKEALLIARSHVNWTTERRGPRYSSSETVTVPTDLFWDIADEVHSAANEILRGAPPAETLLAAVDVVMLRVSDFIGGRPDWEKRRRELDAVVGSS